MTNHANAIRSYADQFDEKLKEIDALKSDEKEYFAELKEAGYPVKGIRKLLADSFISQNQADTSREQLREAGRLLGIAVCITPTEPDKKQADDLATRRFKAMREMRTQAQTLRDELKELKVQAKAEGFVPELILKAIGIKKDGTAAYEQYSLTLDQYLTALK
ncbi:MAG: DUF2312 domain-containing protein [Rhizobiales bacterium]|nr:DUF2312 domain-containing protein [Hyphomicrobiales bacterium]